MNKPAPFTAKQREYLLRCLSSWFNVAEGGKRGGKNVLQTMAFCICLERHANRLHLISGVSTATARLNILDCDGYGMMNYFEGRCRTGQYQNRDCLYVGTATGEKVVLVSGGGKKGDERLIKGNTYGMAYITEANECAPVFLREAFDRTLSSGDRKVFHDLNPKAEGHWYYTDILNFHEQRQADDPAYGYNYGHFTIADNMSVTDEQLHERIATYDKRSVWYQRDILGKRKQAEGLIYPMFNPELHVVPTVARSYDRHYISCDYGTQNPAAFLLWGLSCGVWYCVREYYYSGKSDGAKTDEEYYAELESLAGGLHIRQIIVDPSAASFITLIRKRHKFQVLGANNDVIDGIRNVSSLLKLGLIKFNDCCKNTITEFSEYAWDKKSVEERPVKDRDHAMDSVRYMCRTVIAAPKSGFVNIRR